MSTIIDGTTGITFPDASTQSKAVSQVTPFAVTASAGAGAELQLPEATANGVNYVAVKAPNALAANTTFTLPAADGTNGQVLQTDGSGALGFASVSPGGTTGQVQINSAGAFGAVAEGTAGQVLTSGGAGVAPSFATLVSGSLLSTTVFTASGTWTIGAGTNFIKVRGVGGGGAGGGGRGAGGGAGGYFEVFQSAAGLGSVSVTIGAGGGGNAGANGGSGGSTTVGSIGAANGGTGGNTGNNSSEGGSGGSGTVGTLLIKGGGGGSQFWAATSVNQTFSGAGGSSCLGGGAAGREANITPGLTGGNYGGGGSGSSVSGGTGGNGAPGVIIVEEYT